MDELLGYLSQLGVNVPIALALAVPIGGAIRLAKTRIAITKRAWPWISIGLGVLAGLATGGLSAGAALTGLTAGVFAVAGAEAGKGPLPEKVIGTAKGSAK